MATAVSANRLELLQIADAVAREKVIDRQIVIAAMEDAIQKAARSRYGSETNVKAEINPKSGEIRLYRLREAVETVESPITEISLEEARERNPAAELGDYISEPLPPLDFGRIAAQSAKQVIVQKVRDAERQRQYEEFKDRIGEVVNGVVKRVEYGNVIVDLGRGEAIIRRDELVPRETYRPGDRVRAYIYDVRSEQRGPQIFLSRTHPQFMAKLFAQEVPEIYDGIIEIKSVARDPGSRAKIAVISKDSSIDPVGACVGMRGSRVQAVVNELQGEKIDIIPWSPDAASFIVNALQPAEVVKVVLDEDANRIEVVVPDDQLSLAIGRRGQNVRLASQLTGWDIDILTEQEESERRQKEFAERTEMFMEGLDVDEVVAQLLVSEGFSSMEEVAYVPLSEVEAIEGFDEETAEEIQARAREYLERLEAELDEKRTELGVSDDLKQVEGVTTAMLVALGENDVKTLEDLAGCATDDLVGWTERVNGETQAGARLPRRLRPVARRGRAHRHECPPEGRLGDRGGACRRAGRRRGRRRRERRRGRRVTSEATDTDAELETDAGPRDRRPQRRCIVSRQSRPADELLRFVRAPDGTVAFDIKRRLPGRGAWVEARQESVAIAARKNHFSRAFKAQARAPEDFDVQVRDQLVASLLGKLGLERRAGRLAIGFADCEALLRKGRAALLLHAADAAADGIRKLDQAAHSAGGDLPHVSRLFTAQEMSLAFGRGNVVHAALEVSPGSEAVVARTRLLEDYVQQRGVARDVAGRTE